MFNPTRVKGFGPAVSPLMIISDYPTKDELEQGKSLVGETGKSVERFLKQNKYSIDRCYKTAYIKTAIPGFGSKNKKTKFEALQAAREIDDWDKILLEEIRVINPNVILCLGELPLKFLTHEKNINRYRGSILPLKSDIYIKAGLDNSTGKYIKVVATFHPRDIFFDPISGVYVTLDYKRALGQIHNTREFEEPGTLWIARNAESLIEYWKRARHGKFLVTDIETRFNMVICASLCTDGNEAVSFPMLDLKAGAMQNACIWKKYDDILRSGIPKVNQNMVYDWTVLERLGFNINNIIGDTMLMAHTCYPELPKGLDFLTSIHTDMTYYKDEGKEYDSKLHDFDRMLYYNAKDALATWKVWDLQQNDAAELGVKSFYFNFVIPNFFHYKKINDRGIMLDESALFRLLDKYTDLLALHQQELNMLYGQEINVRSPKQVGLFIYEYLKCPIHTHRTPSGNETYSTDEDTLVNMYLNELEPDDIRSRIIRQIILCRKVESVLNILETPYHFDGRMRTSYNLAGTTTGRTSTSQAIGFHFIKEGKKLKHLQLGTAFQKLPKWGFEFENQSFGVDIREIFVPTPGYEFFSFDGKNAEGRVVCVLSEDWPTLDYIEAGNDLHKQTASLIFNGKDMKYITKEERNLGKRARHAGNLGQSGAGLSTQIYKTIKYCNEVMRKFHLSAPNVQNVFHLSIQKILENSGTLINPFGRRRDFFSLSKHNKHEVFKEAYSFIPQGTISDHFKLISLEIAKSAEWALQLGEFHDGLLFEIPIGYREKFANIVIEKTARKINFETCTLSREKRLEIPVELEFSETNWADMQVMEMEKTVSV